MRRAEPDMGPWVGSHSRDGKQQVLDERMINEVRLPMLRQSEERERELIAQKNIGCGVRPKSRVCIGRHCRSIIPVSLLSILRILQKCNQYKSSICSIIVIFLAHVLIGCLMAVSFYCTAAMKRNKRWVERW